jgi:hypothetical protein
MNQKERELQAFIKQVTEDSFQAAADLYGESLKRMKDRRERMSNAYYQLAERLLKAPRWEVVYVSKEGVMMETEDEAGAWIRTDDMTTILKEVVDELAADQDTPSPKLYGSKLRYAESGDNWFAHVGRTSYPLVGTYPTLIPMDDDGKLVTVRLGKDEAFFEGAVEELGIGSVHYSTKHVNPDEPCPECGKGLTSICQADGKPMGDRWWCGDVVCTNEKCEAHGVVFYAKAKEEPLRGEHIGHLQFVAETGCEGTHYFVEVDDQTLPLHELEYNPHMTLEEMLVPVVVKVVGGHADFVRFITEEDR